MQEEETDSCSRLDGNLWVDLLLSLRKKSKEIASCVGIGNYIPLANILHSRAWNGEAAQEPGE